MLEVLKDQGVLNLLITMAAVLCLDHSTKTENFAGKLRRGVKYRHLSVVVTWFENEGSVPFFQMLVSVPGRMFCRLV